MRTYRARGVRWAKGWELHVEGVGVTQVRTLDKAEQQVRDLIETMTGEAGTDVAVTVSFPELDEYRARVAAAQEAADQAAARARTAAAELRATVAELRDEQHLSVSDVATVLGVSRGRVSQLTRAASRGTEAARSAPREAPLTASAGRRRPRG